MRMRWIGVLVVGACVSLGVALGQGGSPTATPSNAADTETLSADEIAKRDALLKPGLDAMKRGEYTAALEAMRPALAAYPDDLRVLRYAAAAAMQAKDNEESLALFQRALAQHPKQPWPLRLSVLQLNARLGKWEDFDKGLAELRAAKKAGTDTQLSGSNGFLVDEFDAGGKVVQVAFYPLGAGGYHTLYRFLLPKGEGTVSTQAATNGGAADRCQNPNFRPYIDVESDDIDQEAFKTKHPDLAAKGERSYSLDTYPGPCSQGLIKFYFDGEPRYEAVRGDVLGALSGKGKKN